MRSILVLLEDLVREEFGPRDLEAVRMLAAKKLGEPGVEPGPVGRVESFVQAVAEVRRRPLAEVYTFLAMRLVAPVLKQFPALTRDLPSTRSVLLQINQIAPPIVDALAPGVAMPAIDVELIDVDSVRMSFMGASDAASMIEGVVRGLGTHFGERAEPLRVAPPTYAPDRRLIDVKILPERRAVEQPSPPVVERRRFFSH